MRFHLMTSLALAASLAAPLAATAQYQQGVQPYNPQDPQNYGAPAQQSYGTQYPQQDQYQQQPQYAAPQGQYDQQTYPQGGQEQIYQAPPELPTYDQPPAPGEGYIWTPGYWAFGRGGYYWVPGAWVLAPYDGALWTPGYWGYGLTGYYWNPGYWGPEVGYYGGINYGFGYFGIGFYGGYWRDHHFWYNREYWHVGNGFRNVYSTRVNGISNIRPEGRSFATVSASRGNEFRGGSYNNAGRGFAGSQPTNGARGFAGAGQVAIGRPALPGSTYSGMSRGYSAPVQRSYQPAAPSRAQGSNGGYSQQRFPAAQSFHQAPQYSAPAQQHYSAPSAPHYSAPSGGGSSFHGGGGAGGGSFHGGGGGRR